MQTATVRAEFRYRMQKIISGEYMMETNSGAPGVTFLGERPSIDAPELPQKPYEFVMEVDVESLEKMHKVARHRKFEIHVDEPPHLKGDDNHPQPLIYVATGIGA
jgi:hypothetical protein